MKLTAEQLRRVVDDVIAEARIGMSFGEWLDQVSDEAGVAVHLIDDLQARRAYHGGLSVEDFAKGLRRRAR